MNEQANIHKYNQENESLLKRLNRIEGQIQGIQRMIQGDRYCIDIIQQLTSVSSAIGEVLLVILQGHIEGCIADAIREERSDYYIEELMAAIRKAIKGFRIVIVRAGKGNGRKYKNLKGVN